MTKCIRIDLFYIFFTLRRFTTCCFDGFSFFQKKMSKFWWDERFFWCIKYFRFHQIFCWGILINKTWQRARNEAFQKSNVWFENETMWKMKFILRGFLLHRYDIIETGDLMCRKRFVFCKRSTSELMYYIYTNISLLRLCRHSIFNLILKRFLIRHPIIARYTLFVSWLRLCH